MGLYEKLEIPLQIRTEYENPYDPDENYFFRIENIEENPESIMPDPPEDMPFARGGFVFQMITRPVNGESHMISIRDLTHFGTHRINVTASTRNM